MDDSSCESAFTCFLFCSQRPRVCGKQEAMGGNEQLEQRRLWGLSMKLATFRLVSMRQSISFYSGKIAKLVLLFQTLCVILDEATMLTVELVA